jgi:hypothetical protein
MAAPVAPILAKLLLKSAITKAGKPLIKRGGQWLLTRTAKELAKKLKNGKVVNGVNGNGVNGVNGVKISDVRNASYLKKIKQIKEKTGTLRRNRDLQINKERFYPDPKGKGNYSLKSRAMKNKEVSDRIALGIEQKPTLLDYIQTWGKKTGTELFKKEQKLLQGTARKSSKTIHKDHIVPRSRGGVEHSNNMDALADAITNISKGAKLPKDTKKMQRLLDSLLIGKDKIQQIKLQGPQVSPKMRGLLIREWNSLL